MERNQITASIVGLGLVAASIFGAVAAAQGPNDVTVTESQPAPPLEAADVSYEVVTADLTTEAEPTDYEVEIYGDHDEYEDEDHDEYEEHEDHDEYEEDHDDHDEYEDDDDEYEDD